MCLKINIFHFFNDSGDAMEVEISAAGESLIPLDLSSEIKKDVAKALASERSTVHSDLLDWEGCSVNTTHWAVVIQQIERLLPLERLLNLGLRRCRNGESSVTVKLLIDKGKGEEDVK